MAAASLVLGACAFEPGEYPEEGERPDTGSGGTGGTGTGSGSGSGSGTVDPARVCSFNDPALRLCIEFDDSKFDPKVTDASPAQLDAAAQDVDSFAHDDAGVAAAFIWGSKIEVPESPMLDITGAMTLEMWVWPGFAASVNLLENAGQYRIQLAGDGRIGCAFGNSQVWSTDAAELFEWTHAACTYDGTMLRVYLDGALSNTAAGAAAPAGGTTGTKLGGSFAGGLDDIHAYARALTADQICSHAGGSSCSGGSGGFASGD